MTGLSFLNRFSLTTKMVLIIVLVGCVVFAILDQIHTRDVATVFHDQLLQTLNQQAIAYRYRFHSHVHAYHDAAKLFASTRKFFRHVNEQDWSPENEQPVKIYRHSPKWFVGSSVQRSFVAPRYVIVFDKWDQPREIYQNDQRSLPEKLLHPSKRLLAVSQEGSYLFTIDDLPYMATSAQLKNDDNRVLATLMLATPFDQNFLLASQDNYMEGILVALINEDDSQVIVSSDPIKLPAGTTLKNLPEEFISTGQQFFEYGSSEMDFKFVTLASTDTIDRLIGNLVHKVRRQRALTAFVYIFSFALLMFVVTRRIKQLFERVSLFSAKTLGGRIEEITTGDQLHMLENRFQRLTEEVVKSHEVIRREAEEGARQAAELQKREQQVRLLNAVTEAMHIGVMQHTQSGLQAMNDKMRQFEILIGDLGKFDLPKGELKETVITALDEQQFTFFIHCPDILEGEHIILVKDLTEQKITEEEKENLQLELLQVQKMESVGRLAGGVAHDFNNMLSVIIGFSELALMKITEDNPIYDNLKNIHDSGQRAATLTRQLLAFSRKQVLEMSSVDLNMIINNLAKMLTRLIGEDIIFEIHSKAPILYIWADQSQIEQILMNLAVNARDAMPGGGKFIIETGHVNIPIQGDPAFPSLQPGPYAVLSVKDTGSGIPKDVLENIFEPFFTTKASGKGTGLGLSTVYGIVKQHQGHITVKSKEGSGTSFIIYLPVSNQASESDEQMNTMELPKGHETVLVVEDENQVRDYTEKSLQYLGYNVLTAANGEEAVELSERHEAVIEVLLSDVVMPGMTGLALSALLNGKRPGIKIILMTGYSEELIAEHGELPSDITLLQKPVNISKLSVTLRHILDKQ